MTLWLLIKRNVKLFFKDKGMFFTSLITPMILLVLYGTFLSNVYEDSFRMGLPAGLEISDKLMGGLVGGQLISSILAVSGVTVAFCSNMLMVQDKVNGSIHDLTVSPVRPHALALSYYVSTLFSTLIICYAATALCLAYVAMVGWYISFTDVLLLCLDVLLLVLFGTALSSVINFFLSTQGQISAVGSIISAGYGFICGAYMPISQFSDGLQKVILFLPGTYGTSLIRNHAMRGVFEALAEEGFPTEAVTAMQNTVDYNLYFFDNQVSVGAMYTILAVSVAVLVGAYILLHAFFKKKAK
ncbi:MAG: ABC transporter permease [Clostridia bacterium]|nr:ABC transporter permease [Clostridia bacterium]